MALKCGEQFRRRYIENEKIPPGIAAGRGRGVHRANDENLTQKIVTGIDLPEGDLTDCARDEFVHSFDEGLFIPKADLPAKASLLNEGLNDTIRITRAYRKAVAPSIQPLSSEEFLKVDVGFDLPVLGYLDHTERPNGVDVIGDLKTANRSWADGDAEKELQPVVYAFLYEHQYGVRPEFRYDVLVNLKGGVKPQQFKVSVNDRRIKAMFAIIGRVQAMLRSGVFPPAEPGHWVCSEQWCGYYLTCPYVGNGNGHKRWV